MTHFIDRRLNPKGKSLGNRQRFLRRARTQIREAVQKSLKDAAVADIGKERKIKISAKGTNEPRFRLDPRASGERDFVLPGNKDFTPGDTIDKPKSGAGQGGKEASDSGDGEDDFEFTMTQDEILDIFGKKKQRSESATAEGLDISKWQKPAFVQTQSLQINPAFYGDSCIAHMC